MHTKVSGMVVAASLLVAACGSGDTGGQIETDRTTTSAAVTTTGQAAGPLRLTASLSGAGEAPAAGDPDGAGTGTVTLDPVKGEVCSEVTVAKLDKPVGMHIHEGRAGDMGPVVVPLTPPPSGDAKATGCTKADPALVQRIAGDPDGFYLNVHTEPFKGGAVRGQLTKE